VEGKLRRCWCLVDEPFGVGRVGGVEHRGAFVADGLGQAVVDIGWGVQAEPAVAVVFVVPAEEPLAVQPSGLDRGELLREVGPVFERLELRLGVRVVVGDMWSRVGLGDAEIGEQERDRLGGHRGAAVGMDRQLARSNPLLGKGLLDQYLGQWPGLAGGDHPPDDVTGVDVDDHVEVEPRPLRRTPQLGDVPRPHLVRPVRHELRFHRRRVRGLPAAFPRTGGLTQQPIERRDRAQVAALVQQDRPRLGRGQVDEPIRVQLGQDRGPLLGCQGTGLGAVAVRGRRRPRWRRGLTVPPVVAGLRDADRLARVPDPDLGGKVFDRGVGHLVDLASVSPLSESVSKSACSFPCTSTTKRALASSCSSCFFSASRAAILTA